MTSSTDTSFGTRIEKRLREAKAMRNLANEIRSPATRMVSTDGALARIAEAIAVLLEELP